MNYPVLSAAMRAPGRQRQEAGSSRSASSRQGDRVQVGAGMEARSGTTASSRELGAAAETLSRLLCAMSDTILFDDGRHWFDI